MLPFAVAMTPSRLQLLESDRRWDLEDRLSRSQTAVQTYLERATLAEGRLESLCGDTEVVTSLRAEIAGLERRVEGLLQVQGEMSDELCDLRSWMDTVGGVGVAKTAGGTVEDKEDDSLYD